MALEEALGIIISVNWKTVVTICTVVTYCSNVLYATGFYHVISPGRTCQVSTGFNQTISLVCVYAPNSPPSLAEVHDSSSCAFRSLRWQRQELDGQVKNVNESRKYSVWNSLPGGDWNSLSSGEQTYSSRISLLRIASLQSDDFVRYRCEVDCEFSNGRRVTTHYAAELCQKHTRDKYAVCQSHVTPGRCRTSFENGVCEVGCDTEDGLYDGFDCAPPVQPCRAEDKCRRSYADGTCDMDCDNLACSWDGGDCIDKALRLADDVLVLTTTSSYHVSQHRTASPSDTKMLARAVSRHLRTVVRALPADWGTPDTARQSGHSAWHRSSRPTPDPGHPAAVPPVSRSFFKLDNTMCLSRCFGSALTAAKFLSTALRSGWNPGINVASVAVFSKIEDPCALENSTLLQVDVAPHDSSQTRRHGNAEVGHDGPGTALFWLVLAAVVGGVFVVMLTSAVAIIIHRIRHVHRHGRRTSLDADCSYHRSRKDPELYSTDV